MILSDPTDVQYDDLGKQEDAIPIDENPPVVIVIEYVYFQDAIVLQEPNPTFIAALP